MLIVCRSLEMMLKDDWILAILHYLVVIGVATDIDPYTLSKTEATNYDPYLRLL